jgi:hypothetical protein
MSAARTKDEGKPANGEALARYPAFKPYPGKTRRTEF